MPTRQISVDYTASEIERMADVVTQLRIECYNEAEVNFFLKKRYGKYFSRKKVSACLVARRAAYERVNQ